MSAEEAMQVGPERQDDDGRLVARFLQGEESAFDELVLRHRLRVYRLAYRLLGNHSEADDVSQEAFLRAYRGLPGFRGEATFRTWITRIVLNLAQRARHARLATVSIEESAVQGGHAAAQDAVLKHEVRSAVSGLPPRQRQVLVLKVYEGMKFVEIAQAADMSVGTAKATFFQAVRNLRARLGPQLHTREEEEVSS
jgi:RNA polymerase sigma-70 factor, ECF subfamily